MKKHIIAIAAVIAVAGGTAAGVIAMTGDGGLHPWPRSDKAMFLAECENAALGNGTPRSARHRAASARCTQSRRR